LVLAGWFCLFYEFCGVPLEFFLASNTAKMIGLSIVGNLVLSGVFVKYHAANRVSK
jgi:hypothetical protein